MYSKNIDNYKFISLYNNDIYGTVPITYYFINELFSITLNILEKVIITNIDLTELLLYLSNICNNYIEETNEDQYINDDIKLTKLNLNFDNNKISENSNMENIVIKPDAYYMKYIKYKNKYIQLLKKFNKIY